MNNPQNSFPTLPESEQEEFERLSPQEQIERLNTDITSRLNSIKEHELRERHHKNLITSTQQECIGLYALINGIQNEIATNNLVGSDDQHAETVFKGWITNRAPIKKDLDEHGRVAHFYSANNKKWDYDHIDSFWIRSSVPWAPSSQVQHFTSDNPAPSPYDQEVSAWVIWSLLIWISCQPRLVRLSRLLVGWVSPPLAPSSDYWTRLLTILFQTYLPRPAVTLSNLPTAWTNFYLCV